MSLCVYVIPLQLTSRLLVRLTNNMTYSVGNENHLNETISFEKAPLLRSVHDHLWPAPLENMCSVCTICPGYCGSRQGAHMQCQTGRRALLASRGHAFLREVWPLKNKTIECSVCTLCPGYYAFRQGLSTMSNL